MTFISSKNITLYNFSGYKKDGFNSDRRGKDNTTIKLNFQNVIEFNKNFTLKDFVTYSYLCKSHKFDYWYELYSTVKLSVEDDNIKIRILFDHGS